MCLCRVFGTAIAVSAFLNMLIPGAAKIGFSMVMVVRILQGLVEASARPFALSSVPQPTSNWLDNKN